jgi:hypothetical protein
MDPEGPSQQGIASEKQVPPKKEVAQVAFQAAFAIANILKDMSKKDQLTAMRMAGIQAGMTVSSAFTGPVVSTTGASSSLSAKQKERKAPPAPKWGKAVKAQQSKIAALNLQISEKSKKIGAELPAAHPLLQEREQAFRDLKSLKGKATLTK